MTRQPTRREFLADVGRGMLVAGVGWGTALDMGFAARAFAEDAEPALNFGEHEPLVALMQETPADKLLPILAEKLTAGTPLKTLLTAGVLANARSFGGEDYIGFHTLMALGPAYYMSQELPSERRALPVLKVLYRNAARIQATGGHEKEVLHAVAPLAAGPAPLELREAARKLEKARSEQILATLVQQSPEDAFNALLLEVEDETEVHRVNLAYKPWDLLNIIGREHALTMLRQSLRYCVKAEEKNPRFDTRALLAKLFDQFQLEGRTPGSRTMDDGWIESMSMTFFTSPPEQAAEAAAAALVDGVSPDDIAQAAALAANQLVLRDPGRPEKYADKNKPAGSVHGDSMGVHACDAVNAWRNIAKVSNARNQMAAVILAAYEVSRGRAHVTWSDDALLKTNPRPWAEDLEKIKATDPAGLLAEAEDAIRHNDQARAAAIVHRYGETNADARPAFDLLLKYAISEDGALHAEKYYHTVREEFSNWRPAFRWRQLTALARVTASEHGYPAPGYADACRLLKVS